MLVFQSKNPGYNTNNNEIIQIKYNKHNTNKITTDHDHDKFITPEEFNKLTLILIS